MTEKLYYETPVLYECDAKVLKCESTEGGWRALLDKTVIFPEGGGQPADKGFIGEAGVRGAREENGDIWHYCDKQLTEGETYKVRFVAGVRRDHTEQHTGEHILSGVASALFGAKNVGFHMAEDYCTIDFDIYLDENELAVLEREANLVVRLNRTVRAETVDAEQLKALTLRKKSDVKSDNVRIIYIDDGKVDSCTCCGTHFDSTGQVGFIKITDSQKYKGGTRLWFSCGGRAVNYAEDMQRSVKAMARGFSTSAAELEGAVRKQSEELGELKRELKERTKLVCGLIAEKEGHDGAVVSMQPGFAAFDTRLLAEALTQRFNCAALVFGRSGDTTYYSVGASKGVNCHAGELCKAVNAALDGKGGGSASFASGSSKREATPELCKMLENYMTKLLKEVQK